MHKYNNQNKNPLQPKLFEGLRTNDLDGLVSNRFTVDQYSWEIPEGGGLIGVDPLIGAKRELLEETGLIADHWEPLLSMHLSNSVSDELAIIFLARGITQKMAEPEETEQLQIQKLPFEKVYEMVEAGKITDAMSVAAIYKIKLMLLQGKLK